MFNVLPVIIVKYLSVFIMNVSGFCVFMIHIIDCHRIKRNRVFMKDL